MPNTPDTPGVELDQYQQEKDEFAEAVDDVLGADEGKTDDEISADMDKKQADKDLDAGGEPKKDPDKIVAVPKDVVKDPDPPPDNSQGVIADPPATEVVKDPEDTDWKAKAEAAEAELAKEKQKTSSWNGRITAANKKVKELEQTIADGVVAKKPDVDPNADSDNEVLDRFRNDFPELAGVIDILQKRVDGVTTPVKVDDSHIDDGSTDSALEDDQKKKDIEAHALAVRKVHPDLSEMVNTGVLLTWINTQPSYIQPALETIYKNGQADEVINMVTEFKEKTGWVSQLKKADDDTNTKIEDDKLNAMREVNSEHTTPDGKVVDKNDFDQGAKDAGL